MFSTPVLNFARIALSSSLSGVTGDTVCPILRSDLFRKDGRDFGRTGRNDETTVAKMRKKETNNINKIMCSSLYYLLQTLHRIKPVHFDKVPFDDQYAPDARPLVVLSDMLVA